MKQDVQIGPLKLKNPVVAASGTFGFGREMAAWQDLSLLGGICSKGLTLKPRLGNQTPRVAETASGLLNSVGLQNPGLAVFLADELPFMTRLGCSVIVNVAGHHAEDYLELCRQLDRTAVDAIELNLSCPNVREGCMSIGSDGKQIERLVSQARQMTKKPLWAKLTPNVTSIGDMARAAEAGGADAVVLINTLLGMVIDRRTRRPVLRNNTGGLSGPAIKPVALRMVSEVYQAVKIPVIGVGGIMNGSDALEFLIAGASAVEIGSANLISPTACQDILKQMTDLAEEDHVTAFSDYTGTLNLW
ncbi:MAG: dihydroorotate dehydrogenase [Clostridiaceae bacterium]|nr:dihydroorotate dehydrogenase [Clostridiaceae bacterium]